MTADRWGIADCLIGDRMSTVTEALIEQDADGLITDWNTEAGRLFGWPRDEAIGMPSERLIPARNRERYRAGLGILLGEHDRRVLIREITVLHRSGHEFRARFTTSADTRLWGPRITTFAREVTQQERADQAARGFQNAERYRAILDQIEDGCCALDLQGNFLFVNDAFCRMFGFDRDEILGSNFKSCMGVERQEKLRAMYLQVYRTGEPVKAFAYQVSPRNSETRFVEQTISLERDAAGQPVGFLAITRDCSTRKEAEREAEEAKRTAEAANQAKSEFLANMSHEIRTPMNGIIGMTALVLDTELTPFQSECVNTVRVSAESLLTILNDVLDFSKIESRKLELEAVPFSLPDAINDALKPLTLRANQKGLELACDVATGMPPLVVGDPVRIKQIVTNLVGNAIKFTEQGHILVAVREDTRGDGCTKLHVTVADTGIGIPLDKQAAIFEPFKQADGSTTRRFGGTGLGLAISSTLVQMMGGRIWVESAPGTGATFHFTAAFDLPNDRVVPIAPRLAAAKTGMAAAAPVVRRRVLIAEDNLVNQRVASGLLTRRGHNVIVVNNGREAIAALESGAFDLVLMDLQMPEMGGLEATEAIRAKERTSGGHVRIVAMTAHAMNGVRERCAAAGMDGYLSKPLDTQILFSIVEDAVAIQQPDGPAPAATTATTVPGADTIDRAALLNRLGGDEQLVSDVIQLFLRDCPARLDAIKTAVAERHAERIRLEAHALKGAAGNLSATGLFEAARTLERIGAEMRLDAAEAGWRLLSMEAARTLDALRRFEVGA